MILKKAKNLCHVIGDRGFDPRGDVLDLILEDKILLLQLRSSWARRFEMLRLSTLASERYTSIRLHEALQVSQFLRRPFVGYIHRFILVNDEIVLT